MRKRVLRLVLGLGYVLLLTVMLLYQAGVFGERRNWGVAMLTTLFLGVALAVVLALYMRVSEQIRKEGGDICQRKKAELMKTGQRNETGTDTRTYCRDYREKARDAHLSEAGSVQQERLSLYGANRSSRVIFFSHLPLR